MGPGTPLGEGARAGLSVELILVWDLEEDLGLRLQHCDVPPSPETHTKSKQVKLERVWSVLITAELLQYLGIKPVIYCFEPVLLVYTSRAESTHIPLIAFAPPVGRW